MNYTVEFPTFVKNLRKTNRAFKRTFKKGLTNTSLAIRTSGVTIHEDWARFGLGHKVFDNQPEYRNVEYARSIQQRSAGLYTIVYTNMAREHNSIIRGKKEFDFKSKLSKYKKSKKSKDGFWYLRVPIRHSIEELKEAGEYSKASRLSYSSIKSVNPPRNSYTWGDKLKSANKNLNNVYRFNISNNSSRGRSAYVSFRTASEKSKPNSWIFPKREGFDIIKALIKKHKEVVVENIRNALISDLTRILTNK